MFVVIAYFPPVKAGKDAEFKEWFAWSEEMFAGHKGFVARRLLQSHEDGNYVALIEFESHEDFTAMAKSPAHAASAERVLPLLEGTPTPAVYEVVMG
jgi:heme-degrading monooxygenase HmoA